MAAKKKARAKRKAPDLECPEQLRPLLAPIDSITPDPANPRTGHDIRAISASLKKLGWHAPIVVDLEGVVSVHHGCLEAAKRLKQTQVPVLRCDDDRARALARNVADNAAGEGSVWDLDLLADAVDYSDTLADMVTDIGLDDLAAPDEPPPGPSGDDTSEDNPKLAAFIKRREASRARGADKNEVNFWLCLVFQSHGQKLEFLARYPGLETKYDMYVDGEAFAEAVGADVTPNEQKPVVSHLDKALSELVS